jgi:hypothetical protein
MATNTHFVEVEVGADGLASAPPSGSDAAPPPAGAHDRYNNALQLLLFLNTITADGVEPSPTTSEINP